MTFPAGSRLLAEDLAIIDQILSPTEQSYTPAWTSSGSAPSLGNGTRLGRYWRAGSGLWVYAEIQFVWGSTTAPGTGVWFWSLPVTAAANQVSFPIGTAYYLDSGTAEGAGVVKMETTTTVRVLPAEDTNSNNWGQTTPVTWAVNDIQRLNVLYRAA